MGEGDKLSEDVKEKIQKKAEEMAENMLDNSKVMPRPKIETASTGWRDYNGEDFDEFKIVFRKVEE